MSRSSLWLLVAVSVVVVLIVWLVATSWNVRMLDLENYVSASRMLWLGEDPYGSVEFFAPPWLALCLFPLIVLPPKLAVAVWLFVNVLAVGGAVALSTRWLCVTGRLRRMFLMGALPVLIPGVLFCYVTGQIVPLVGLAMLFCAWRISSGMVNWIVAIGLLFATFKPHVVVLPVLICVLELIRRREWSGLLRIAVCMAVASVFAFAVLPDWPVSLIGAWVQGDYRGGRPGLVATGYWGLRELGIPLWAMLPLALYTVSLWWRRGLNAQVFSLALTTNLLLVPYSRRYDHVLLILPFLSLMRFGELHDYGILLLAILALFVAPVTKLFWVLTPVLMTLALLLKGVTNVRAGARVRST